MNISIQRGPTIIGSITLNVTVNDIIAVGTIAPANMVLPAGRWQVITQLNGSPDGSNKPITVFSADTTLPSGGVIATAAATLNVYRPFTAPSRSITAQVVVQVWDGSKWLPYAYGNGSLSVSVMGAPSITTNYGVAGLHLYVDVEGPERGWWQTGMDRMAELGVSWLRLSIQQFSVTSYSSAWNPNHQTMIDNFIGDAADRGLTVINTIAGATPCWISSQGGKDCVSRNGRAASAVYPPTDNWASTQQFVKEMCDRYAFEAIEPTNEPNGGALSHFTDADHVTMQSKIYAGIQASANPVPLLGMVTSMLDTAWMDRMYAAGIAPYMDAMCLHPYPLDFRVTPWAQPASQFPFDVSPWGPGEAIDLCHLNMVSHGDGSKPVWVTETGYAGLPRNSFIYSVSEDKKGEYLDYMIRQAARIPYLGGFAVFSAVEPPSYPNSGTGFGLCDNQWNRKPSFDVVKAAIADVQAGNG